MAKTKASDQGSLATTVVIGDGWAATAVMGLFTHLGQKAVWVAGSQDRVIPPLPGMEEGPGAELLAVLAEKLGLEIGKPATALSLREFKNKSFRPTPWSRAAQFEMKQEVFKESLWASENRIAPMIESRFELPLAEVEAQIREKLLAQLSQENCPFQRIEGDPVKAFTLDEKSNVKSVVLGSGLEIQTSNVIYADQWALVPRIENVPQGSRLARKREPMGLFQAVLTHQFPLKAEVKEGFYTTLHRDAGDEFDRSVFGSFVSLEKGKTQSVWSLVLTPDEGLDNHQIGKKFRRMKQALDRAFIPSEWFEIPAQDPIAQAALGIPAQPQIENFSDTVETEQVRYLESVLFASGEIVQEPETLSGLKGVVFLTDGYGMEPSYAQVKALFASHFESLGLNASTATVTAET